MESTHSVLSKKTLALSSVLWASWTGPYTHLGVIWGLYGSYIGIMSSIRGYTVRFRMGETGTAALHSVLFEHLRTDDVCFGDNQSSSVPLLLFRGNLGGGGIEGVVGEPMKSR